MMDADFRRYLAAIKAEEPTISAESPRWKETEALASRLAQESRVEAALKSLEGEPLRRKRWDLLLLTALLREALGERPAALDSLEVVADKLVASGDRVGVRLLLEKFLEPEPATAAVRFLEFLARGETDDAERIELLREAIAIRPGDPGLHDLLAPPLDRSGDSAGAREHRLRAIELELDLGRGADLADPLLRAVEEDLEALPARVGRMLLRFASIAAWEDSEPILDLALPELERRAAGLLSWEDIAPVAPKVPARPAPRKLAARLLRVAVAREPDPDAIVEGSGIADPAQLIAAAAERLPRILALPPAARVAHTTWGVGKVEASDGDSLTLQFPGRAGHKMSFAMASKSLLRLPEDGLRVKALDDSAGLRALLDGGDPDVIVRALRDIGGAGTSAQLRSQVEAALPGADWNHFWKQAKDRLKGDGRIDLSEAYRQTYRLAPDGFEGTATSLPRLTPRAVSEGLGLIRRFLRDHPEEAERLRDHATPVARRWALDESLEPTVRAQALCHVLAWEGLSRNEAAALLDQLISQGLGPDDLTLSANQDQLLGLAVGSPREADFLWRAVESRLARLRERGRTRLKEMLGARYAPSVEQRITRAADAPGLAARLIEHYAAARSDPDAPSSTVLLVATLRLLERELPDGVPERLLALLAEDGALRGRVAEAPPEEQTRTLLEGVVLHWAGSERRLNPVLEMIRSAGHAAVADEYERRRRARAESLVEGKTTEDVETHHTIMTRRTYERLQGEMKRLALELKTTIPAAIEKARQLGDLRENAEYEAAKQKQANAAARLQELMNTLERTRLLETIEVDPSRVGVGTETVLVPLEGDAKPITYWILGEGDGGVEAGVLSYRAPILRPLLGKTAGTEVVLETPEGARRYRIESIVKRLPA
jgi:transcription elongation factor GreA